MSQISEVFPGLKGKLGFGTMRLPVQDGQVAVDQVIPLVDAYLEGGFNYFETAQGHRAEQSLVALREALVERHDRDEFLLAAKIASEDFASREVVRASLESQLEALGVDSVDYCLAQTVSMGTVEQFEAGEVLAEMEALKNEGKIGHVGMVFHDLPALLERLLDEHPSIEFVQLQLNYVDWDGLAVKARRCYEVCAEHNVPIIAMGPLKGGALARIEGEAAVPLGALNADASAAHYAFRFVGELDDVACVLSDMSTVEQVQENARTFTDLQALSADEKNALNDVAAVFKRNHPISCDGCRECVGACPSDIKAPDLFACYNMKMVFPDGNADHYYFDVYTQRGGKASDCMACGACMDDCPRYLGIPRLMSTLAAEFEGIISKY